MFSKILYINLDRRHDRKENVDAQLKIIRYNGLVERISAVDAKQLDFDVQFKTLKRLSRIVKLEQIYI
jgi:GR25 family glycosyltransferase involved in LPS biosynthesis